MRLIFAGCFAFAAVLCSASAVWGQIIAFDTFESYASGAQVEDNSGVQLNGGTGFTTPYNVLDARRTNVTITSGGLNYSGGAITFNGGNNAMQSLNVVGTNEVLSSRSFANQTGTVYLSFLYNNTVDVGNVSDFFQVGLDQGFVNPRVSAIDNANEFHVRSTTGSAPPADIDSNITSNVGQTYFIVLKAQKVANTNYNNISIFVDPTSKTEGLNTSTTTTLSSGISSLSEFVLRWANHENGDTFVIDNLRVALDFDAATGLAPTADANGPHVFSEGALSVTLDGSASADLDGSVAQYDWTVPGGTNISTGSSTAALSLANSGLTSTVDTNTISLQVTDNDDRVSTNTAETTLSYNNTAPEALGVMQEIFLNGDSEFTVSLRDLDLSANADIAGFETLVWELSAMAAASASEVGDGDGFAGGTLSPSTDLTSDMDTVTLAELIDAFGEAGEFTAFLNVRDLAGDVNDPGSFSSISFQLLVTPEPASLAVWTLLGLIGLGYGWRRWRIA